MSSGRQDRHSSYAFTGSRMGTAAGSTSAAARIRASYLGSRRPAGPFIRLTCARISPRMTESFDVFLSHNSKDKLAIRKLSEVLRCFAPGD